ncbi:hypothetical protein KC19_11G007700 [Ceratodon purpureus]|uniref:Uncharacterized protein n=1 Tax=Ceratodon purpureus TaxID=3225 RepID=A0A8T0G9I5_CERPU|nr:hypothetical protein KC19_11G007700 [Ceratodon purpureus]
MVQQLRLLRWAYSCRRHLDPDFLVLNFLSLVWANCVVTVSHIQVLKSFSVMVNHLKSFSSIYCKMWSHRSEMYYWTTGPGGFQQRWYEVKFDFPPPLNFSHDSRVCIIRQ